MKKLFTGLVLMLVVVLMFGSCSTTNFNRSITSTFIDDSGCLIIVYSDGVADNLGCIIGPQGIQGERGEQGEKGDKGDIGPAGRDGVDGETPVVEIINGYWYINGEATGYKVDGVDVDTLCLANVTYGQKLNFTFRPVKLARATPYSSGYYMYSYYYDSVTQQNYEIYVKISADEYASLLGDATSTSNFVYEKVIYTISGTVVYMGHFSPNLDTIVVIPNNYYITYI